MKRLVLFIFLVNLCGCHSIEYKHEPNENEFNNLRPAALAERAKINMG